MTQDGSTLLVKKSFEVTDVTVLEVFFSNKRRRNLYVPDARVFLTEAVVVDARLSEDKRHLAVMTRSSGSARLSVSVLTYIYNGTSFNELENVYVGRVSADIYSPPGRRMVESSLSPIIPGSLELSADGFVIAAAVCGTLERIHVYSWNGGEWVRRDSPPIPGIPCMSAYSGSARTPPTSFLQLSEKGDILAFMENFNRTEAAVLSYQWDGSKWESLSRPFPAMDSPMGISLSSDGGILAVGLPFVRLDDGGETITYSRPLSSLQCSENGNVLLHFSLTPKQSGQPISWALSDSYGSLVKSGFSSAPDATILSQVCLEDISDNCYSLTVFADYAETAPDYGLVLDGTQLDHGSVPYNRYRLQEIFGNCSSVGSAVHQCPPNTSLVEVITTLTTDRIGQPWRIVDLDNNALVAVISR